MGQQHSYYLGAAGDAESQALLQITEYNNLHFNSLSHCMQIFQSTRADRLLRLPCSLQTQQNKPLEDITETVTAAIMCCFSTTCENERSKKVLLKKKKHVAFCSQEPF